MEEAKPVEIWEMIRMVAATRIMPETQVRLSAGRMNMSREGQAMCFFWGQFNFAGDKLLLLLTRMSMTTWKCLKC
jgi:biotin synthase